MPRVALVAGLAALMGGAAFVGCAEGNTTQPGGFGGDDGDGGSGPGPSTGGAGPGSTSTSTSTTTSTTSTSSGPGCASDQKLCNGVCESVSIDVQNCGDCGVACAEGESCIAGECKLFCSGGSTECGGSCVDTDLDPKHCGGCDKACDTGDVCVDGACAANCGVNLGKCGEVCVDIKKDPKNCGSCGNECAASAQCIDGSCVECDSNTTDCDADGWKKADGDCCDKPGACGSEPGKVNPGAIEVVGNGLDDNCNGKTDLFDKEDTVACDAGLSSSSNDALDYAKALGLCRQTTEDAPLAQKTWGLIDAKLLRADGTPLGDAKAASIRPSFGSIDPAKLEGESIVVLSTGIAADGSQTNPGPNGGAPVGTNVSKTHAPSSSVSISTAKPLSVNDWYKTPNPPLKPANGLPDAPGCGLGDDPMANDSVMLYLKLRAPTNAQAFSFNSYFLSAEYPEYVCSNYNDQLIALVDTNGKTTSPIPNPADKNLMTYFDGTQKWPIGVNIAAGTDLFAVCALGGSCSDFEVSQDSCSLGVDQLAGTGFEAKTGGGCAIGGGTFWLTTAGNVVPGEIVELRIAIWDVSDHSFDSMALIDGFKWLSAATLPGTGNK